MTLVKGSTSENGFIPVDYINVAYLPRLVSPVRITCVFLGDKKPQKKTSMPYPFLPANF